MRNRLRKNHGMSADGTYGFVYRGATGLGIGVFTIRDNVVKGADWAVDVIAAQLTSVRTQKAILASLIFLCRQECSWYKGLHRKNYLIREQILLSTFPWIFTTGSRSNES